MNATTQRQVELHFLRTAAPAGVTPETMPTRLLLLRWGDNESTKGVYRVTDHTLSVLNANQRAYGLGRVALDFEHNTVPGTPAYQESKEPRDVAAYGIPELVPGEGLYLNSIEWTAIGREKAGNFADLSPAVAINPETREVILLHSSALTRAGAVYDIHFLNVDMPAAAAQVTIEALVVRLQEMEARLGYLGELQQALGRAQDENAALKAAVQALTDKLNAMPPPPPPADLQPLSAAIAPMPGRIEALAAQVDSINRRLLVMRATAAGKVLPLSDDQVERTSLETLSAIIANLPAGQVPMSRGTPAVHPLSAGGTPAGSPLETIARMCGVPLADIQAHQSRKQ